MSWDLDLSLKNNLLKKKWIFADKYFRIGNPFEWVDGELQLSKHDFSGVIDLLQWYSGYYEKYETLDSFLHKDYNNDYKIIHSEFKRIFVSYFPFLDSENDEYSNYINCHSLSRTQDICVFRNFAKNLFNKDNIHHLDFGSGLGGASIYSLKILKSVFTSIEAHKWSYNIQRLFYRKVINENQKYLDLVSYEPFAKNEAELKELINSKNFSIKQIPSWYFEEIDNNSQDLITATTCLNEINNAGIVHFIINANRVLKTGGYIYFRDSNKRKPGRNIINYDEIFELVLGYKVIKKFDLINRKDIFAIPRIYQKTKETSFSFEKLFNKIIGFEAVTSHGGSFSQNLKK